jgi:hypothetical protein
LALGDFPGDFFDYFTEDEFIFRRLELLRLFLCLADGLLFLLDLRGDDFPGLSAIDYFFRDDGSSSFSFLFLSSVAAV